MSWGTDRTCCFVSVWFYCNLVLFVAEVTVCRKTVGFFFLLPPQMIIMWS